MGGSSARVSVPTLWDLAAIVLEEVEKVCVDERCVLALSREILIRMIRGHVRNMEVEWPAPSVAARGESVSAGRGAKRRTSGG